DGGLCGVEGRVLLAARPDDGVEAVGAGAGELVGDRREPGRSAVDEGGDGGADTGGDGRAEGLQPVESLAGEGQGKRLTVEAVDQSIRPEGGAVFGHVDFAPVFPT